MTSREKVLALRDRFLEVGIEDQQLATLAALVLPAVESLLPDDPDDLDAMLATLAKWSTEVRSDDAAPLALCVWEPTLREWGWA